MIRKKSIDPEKARLKMADLCARSEQCEYDIREKLKRWQLPSAAIEEIIDSLKERRFIDNFRFAKSFTNDKVKFSAWGRNKIRQALKLKRIPAEVIEEAFEDFDSEEYNKALLRAAKAKASALDLSIYEDKAKLYRHLLSRGFESRKISAVINKLKEE